MFTDRELQLLINSVQERAIHLDYLASRMRQVNYRNFDGTEAKPSDIKNLIQGAEEHFVLVEKIREIKNGCE